MMPHTRSPQEVARQQNVIRFWHVLEYLAPFDLPRALTESLRYFRLEENCRERDFPWRNPGLLDSLKLNPSRGYRYTIYFGVFETEAALADLRRLLGVERPSFFDPPGGTTCFGAFSIGGDGYPAPETLSLSALPWAVGHLGGGDLQAELRDTRWSESFNSYRSGIFSRFFEGADLRERIRRPFGADLLVDLCDYSSHAADWSPRMTPLAYCIIDEDRSTRRSSAEGGVKKGEAGGRESSRGREEVDATHLSQAEAADEAQPLEAAILNSFYVGDLARVFLAVASADVGTALDHYLDERVPPDRISLLDENNLERWCAPEMLPAGRWASDDGQYQSLMQQVAINVGRDALRDGGLFSVNGPPGTGKTTMLRDLVASIIVERAERLAEFAAPNEAFTRADEMSLAGGKSFQSFTLDARLTGFEIVVASSNNGAVENVTREIPGAKSIGEEYRERAAYFTDVARHCLKPDDKGAPPWGLVAAVLGNSRNRYEFAQKFWFDKYDEEQESLLGTPRRMTFKRHLNERPSGIEDWKRAKAKFNAARHRTSELASERQRWEQALSNKRALEAQLRAAETRAQAAERAREEAAVEVSDRTRAVDEGERERQAQNQDIESIARGKPHAFFYLRHSLRKIHPVFAVSKVEQYEARMNRAQDELDRIRAELQHRKEAKRNAQEYLGQSRTQSVNAGDALRTLAARREQLARIVEEGKCSLEREAFADEEWWARDERTIQLRAPWLDAELNRARAELFLAALALHQTFIEVARDRVRRNISLWADMIAGKLKGSPEQILSLWQTFFLVVPVVSTTFASVGRMFGELGREALGWLLVDEAGQATPQAAVGALWRARRAVVVGDPLQIEPVVALEDPIINRIAEHFGLSRHWRPSSSDAGASAQKLADHLNRYGGLIGEGENVLWVGCPLRVHRRCANPMFDISNRIAYGGLMIKASDDAPPSGERRLGRSRWISVGGSCQGKQWVPEQGRRVLKMLAEMSDERADTLPQVFIISPFRNVAYRLAKMLEEERGLWVKNGVGYREVKQWIKRSVGTVHTFQGKEAPTVILLLGTDRESAGARRWASGKPNILNVAATRAQQHLYIVGDEQLWKGLPHFDVASSSLENFSKGASR